MISRLAQSALRRLSWRCRALYAGRFPALLGLALATLAAPSEARASGAAYREWERPFELEQYGDTLVVTTSFGLMISADRGKNWYFDCESVLFGYPLSEFESFPLLLELAADGSIISGSERGLRVSHDQGCSFAPAPDLPVTMETRQRTGNVYPGPPGKIVGVHTRAPGTSASSLVVAATLQELDGKTLEHQFYESRDNALSFAKLGAAVSRSSLETLEGFALAPSDRQRFYLSGRRAPGQNHELWVSLDGGMEWSAQRPIPDTTDAKGVFILGVHPADPNTLFIHVQRSIAITETAGRADEAILVTKDGGQTFTQLLRKNAVLLGFAISPDGARVAAGYGSSGPTTSTSEEEFGVYTAASNTLDFQHRYEGAITCMTWNADSLYVCGMPHRWIQYAGGEPLPGADASRARRAAQDFVVAKRSDLNFTLADAEPFEEALLEKQARGPLPWTAGGRGQCMFEWLGAGQAIGFCLRFAQCPLDGHLIEFGPGPPLCTTPDHGTAGKSGTGWNTAEPSQCGCRVPGGTRKAQSSAILGGLLLLHGVRRRHGTRAS